MARTIVQVKAAVWRNNFVGDASLTAESRSDGYKLSKLRDPAPKLEDVYD